MHTNIKLNALKRRKFWKLSQEERWQFLHYDYDSYIMQQQRSFQAELGCNRLKCPWDWIPLLKHGSSWNNHLTPKAKVKDNQQKQKTEAALLETTWYWANFQEMEGRPNRTNQKEGWKKKLGGNYGAL